MGSQRVGHDWACTHTKKGLEELPYINDLTTSLLGFSSLEGTPTPFLSGYASLLFFCLFLLTLKKIFFLQCWLVCAIQQCKSALIMHISLPPRASLSSFKRCFSVVLSYLCVVSNNKFCTFFFFLAVFPPWAVFQMGVARARGALFLASSPCWTISQDFWFSSRPPRSRKPRWCSGKESTCQRRRCKRCGFDPWVRKIPWRRKWQPTPVFLPGKSHGQKSLVSYSPWSCKESALTEHRPPSS